MSPYRRFKLLLLMFVAGCTSPTLNGEGDSGATRDEPADWSFIEREVRRRVALWAEEGRLARGDGSIYTVDIAQLMDGAARSGDRGLYDTLRRIAEGALIDDTDPFLEGFVAWKTHPDRAKDATGTTEALRLAEALWSGAHGFGLRDEKALARSLIDGYRRHSYVDQGVWLVRNYYNLSTQAFAQNSFVIDYDPDLLWRLAADTQDASLSALAERTSRLVGMAKTPTGLLHEMIQPELLTAMPALGTAFFSPNNQAQLANSCAVLERSLRDHRDDADQLLSFALLRQENLGLIYDVETGARHPRGRAGVETYGCLIRLAHQLGRPADARGFEENLAWFVRDFFARENQPRAFIASELLRTALAVL